MKINYDVCLLSLSEIRYDARVLNVAKTLAKHGAKVCIISLGNQDEVVSFSQQGIRLFKIPELMAGHAWKKTKQFHSAAKKYFEVAGARKYWAGDLYTLYTASQLARKFNSELIYDSREIYSALGPLHSQPIKQKVLTAIEKILVRKVDIFVVSGELDDDYLKKHFGTEKPFHIIMNLPAFRKPLSSDLLREKYAIPKDKCIIIYQGMILPGRGLLPAVNALKHFSDAYLCIFGDGSYREKVETEAEKAGTSDRVIFCGLVPYGELHKWTSSADVGLCFIEPVSFSYELALPNKLFEYMMASVPVLASDLPAMRKVIDETATGILINNDASPEEMAESLKILYGEKKKFASACLNQAGKYSYESQEEKILKIVGVR